MSEPISSEALVERVRSGVIVAEPPFEEALDALAERLKAAEDSLRKADIGIKATQEFYEAQLEKMSALSFEAGEAADRAEAQRDELVEALERICDIGETRDVEVARAALAKVSRAVAATAAVSPAPGHQRSDHPEPPEDDPFLPIGHPTC